jgi:acyl-CoA reductase-like NAD-dependent aldehyde dehydrogenase
MHIIESIRMDGKFEPMDISERNAPFTGITTRFPAGVISMIAPFNFPLNLAVRQWQRC